MPIEFWAGRQEPETTHEMAARMELMEGLSETFGAYEGLVAAVFDFSCGTADLDLALFKRDAIIVVELKECSDPIYGSENGRWSIGENGPKYPELKGGRHGNPFQQVKHYRYAMMDYLTQHRCDFLPKQKAAQAKFGHVSGMIAVSPDLHRDSRLNLEQERLTWFRITGLPDLPKHLYQRRSREIDLADDEIRRLVQDVLRCDPVQASPKKPALPMPEPRSQADASPIDFMNLHEAQVYPWAEATSTYDQCHICGALLPGTYCTNCQSDWVDQVECCECLLCSVIVPENRLLDHLIMKHSDLSSSPPEPGEETQADNYR
jgi:hypothetical protein